uniref:Prolyl endopeptidase n=1 Tax=Meloidogyne javanica TaxID=6303 RepID=A0A915MFC9_MELJA
MIVKHVLSNCRFFVSKSSNKRRFLLPIKQQLALFSSSKSPQMSSSSIDINPKCYPLVERGNVVDDYHGKKIPDPYCALEEPDAEITKDFVQKINSISEPFFQACSCREVFRERLISTWDYEKFSCPSMHGDYYYYFYNSGLQNHYVLYQQKTLDEKGNVFMDPNTWSEDGTTSLSHTSWTEDGTLLAYGVSEKGSDWKTIKFKKCTGEELPDVIPGVKFSGLSWVHDNSGVFYSKYPEVKTTTEGSSTEKHEFHSLYFHRLGTDSKDDVLVYERRDDPGYFINAWGCNPKNQLHYFDLTTHPKTDGKLEFVPLFDKSDATYSEIDSDDNSALIMTNFNAPMFKIVRVKIGQGATPNQNDNWEVIIDEDPKRKLDWAMVVDGNKLLACYMEDVKNTLYVHDLNDGKLLYQIPFDIGTIAGVSGRKNKSKIFIYFTSFFTPSIIYKGDFANCSSISTPIKLTEMRRTQIKGIKSEDFIAEQIFYTSKDGTKIPMFVLYNKSLSFDGNNGAILYGYGGYNIARQPDFSVSRLLFLKHFGGVYAIANIRGGGEYGEKWHEEGMRDKKQNVFDDFIYAAEELTRLKYTKPEKLAIHGHSNGGLLTAVCAQQRPDLFGAVVVGCGVLDMLRFHKFTIGEAWISEFGNPDVPEDFEYSPLHQISVQPNVQWPAMLITSADHDDRVVPLHTLKYLAQLYYTLHNEASDRQTRPVLGRIEVKAGHGAGKPTAKIIDEIVDMYSFLQRVLDLKWID